jgi:hypothetical protein
MKYQYRECGRTSKSWIAIVSAIASMKALGHLMAMHPWKTVGELTENEKVCILLAAGVDYEITMGPNGPQIEMRPAMIDMRGGRYVVYSKA